MSSDIPFRERISCTVQEAVQATGIGQRKIYELLPEIESRKVGRRRLILVQALIKHLEGGGEANDEATA